LTQQILAERAEKTEFKEMLEQEGKELEAAIRSKQALESELHKELDKVNPCAMLHWLHS
jgi:arsenate reductase-like glutaredoxin family protein